jgi:PAS domain-containing protein
MAQQSVETILVRQLAGYLSVPILVVDPTQTVIFYNEPAERILGVRFEETGRISPQEAEHLIDFDDHPAGELDEEATRPVTIALRERRPAHSRRSLLRRSDRLRLQVEITALPLIGQAGTLLGALVMFWEGPGP